MFIAYYIKQRLLRYKGRWIVWRQCSQYQHIALPLFINGKNGERNVVTASLAQKPCTEALHRSLAQKPCTEALHRKSRKPWLNKKFLFRALLVFSISSVNLKFHFMFVIRFSSILGNVAVYLNVIQWHSWWGLSEEAKYMEILNSILQLCSFKNHVVVNA